MRTPLISAAVSLGFLCSCGTSSSGDTPSTNTNSIGSTDSSVPTSTSNTNTSSHASSTSPSSTTLAPSSVATSTATHQSSTSQQPSHSSDAATGNGDTAASSTAEANNETSADGSTGSGATRSSTGSASDSTSTNTAAAGCSRDSLNAATESYVAALEAGDTSLLTLTPDAEYIENTESTALTEGIWATAIPIEFHRSILDVEACQTFTEVIVTKGGHPYVIGTRLKVEGPNISEIEALVTDDGDWLFDANAYLRYSSAEDWSVLEEAQRSSREVLIAAANAYFDIFSDPETVVPWGTPCTRLEGGKGYTGSTCDVGIPEGISFADKRFVVDLELGSVVGLVRFGGPNGLPDSHLFRVIDGKIRYVHTITVCSEPNCGM